MVVDESDLSYGLIPNEAWFVGKTYSGEWLINPEWVRAWEEYSDE